MGTVIGAWPNQITSKRPVKTNVSQRSELANLEGRLEIMVEFNGPNGGVGHLIVYQFNIQNASAHCRFGKILIKNKVTETVNNHAITVILKGLGHVRVMPHHDFGTRINGQMSQ